MKSTNTDSRNIIVRELSKADNRMLSGIKNFFNVKFNNIALMKAGYAFEERGKEIKQLQNNVKKLETKIEGMLKENISLKATVQEIESSKLYNELRTLKAKVREHFAAAIKFGKEDSDRRKEIESFLNGTQKKPVKKQRRF